MNAPRDIDSIVSAWLEEGPTRLPDQTRRSITVALPTTSQQRRALRVPWRFTTMSTMPKLAVGAVAVIAVLLGGAFLLRPADSGNGIGGAPIVSPSPSPSPTPSPTGTISPSPSSGTAGPLDTSNWTPYVSTQYDFSIGHPADWTEQQHSDRPWVFPADATCCPPPGTETFLSAPGDVGVSAWSVAIPAGESLDTWVQKYCQVMEADSACTALQGSTLPATVDGHAGRLVQFTSDTQAFFLVGDKVYVVACWRPQFDGSVVPYGGASRLLKGYLSTMRLLPGGAPSPGPSGTPRPS